MAPSWFKLLLVALLVIALFGRGRISDMMGDLAKGIKSFKKGLSEDDTAEEPKAVDQERAKAALEAPMLAREEAKAG